MASNPIALGVAALMNRKPGEQHRPTRGRPSRRGWPRARQIRQERDG